jgi:hypothetical protein
MWVACLVVHWDVFNVMCSCCDFACGMRDLRLKTNESPLSIITACSIILPLPDH